MPFDPIFDLEYRTRQQQKAELIRKTVQEAKYRGAKLKKPKARVKGSLGPELNRRTSMHGEVKAIGSMFAGVTQIRTLQQMEQWKKREEVRARAKYTAAVQSTSPGAELVAMFDAYRSEASRKYLIDPHYDVKSGMVIGEGPPSFLKLGHPFAATGGPAKPVFKKSKVGKMFSHWNVGMSALDQTAMSGSPMSADPAPTSRTKTWADYEAGAPAPASYYRNKAKESIQSMGLGMLLSSSETLTQGIPPRKPNSPTTTDPEQEEAWANMPWRDIIDTGNIATGIKVGGMAGQVAATGGIISAVATGQLGLGLVMFRNFMVSRGVRKLGVALEERKKARYIRKKVTGKVIRKGIRTGIVATTGLTMAQVYPVAGPVLGAYALATGGL